MTKAMKARAQEIERLRMEMQRTSTKQKEDIPELMSGSLEEFVQEETVTQLMRLWVGAPNEFLDKVGGPLQRPTDHAGANDQGLAPPPRDHVPAYRIWEVLRKSHTAYMTRYTARATQEPKGCSPIPKHQDRWARPRSQACTSATRSSKRSTQPLRRRGLLPTTSRGCVERGKGPRPPLPVFGSNGDTGSASVWRASPPPSGHISCNWQWARNPLVSILPLGFAS